MPKLANPAQHALIANHLLECLMEGSLHAPQQRTVLRLSIFAALSQLQLEESMAELTLAAALEVQRWGVLSRPELRLLLLPVCLSMLVT